MHSLGYSPLFVLFRCVYRSFESPRFLGGAAALFGYLASIWGRSPVALPPELVRFLRSEQNDKLKRLLRLRARP
jgi:hypothetical protein